MRNEERNERPPPPSLAPSTAPARPCWVIRLPSIYYSPPAAQRRLFQIRVRGNDGFALQLEDGVCSVDYARSIRFWRPSGELQRGNVHSDFEAELIEDATIIASDLSQFANLNGGGVWSSIGVDGKNHVHKYAHFDAGDSSKGIVFGGGQQERKIEDMDGYAKTLTTVYACMPACKRDSLKLLVRGVPGLLQRLQKLNGDSAKVNDMIMKAADAQGISLLKDGAAGSSRGRSRSEPPVKNTRHAKTKEMVKEWHIVSDQWNCIACDYLVHGKLGLALVESASKAEELWKSRSGYEGQLAIISPAYVSSLPKHLQSEVFFDAVESVDGEEVGRNMMRGILIQLGSVPVTQNVKNAPITISKNEESTAVLHMEVLLDHTTESVKQAIDAPQHSMCGGHGGQSQHSRPWSDSLYRLLEKRWLQVAMKVSSGSLLAR